LAHTQAELIRAVLEGVAFSLRAALEVISEITRSSTLGNRWRSALQRVVTILADVLQTELITPKAEEELLGSSNWQWWGWCVPKFRSCIQDTATG